MAFSRKEKLSNNLAKILKQRRVMIPLTLQELGAMSGVSASHLGRIEWWAIGPLCGRSVITGASADAACRRYYPQRFEGHGPVRRITGKWRALPGETEVLGLLVFFP